MAAREEVRAVIIGEDRASEAFSKAGRSVEGMGVRMDAATKASDFLDDALKRQRKTALLGADASLALAKSDEILAEVEHRLRDGALEAELALKKEAEAKKQDAAASRRASEENSRFAASLQKIASWKDKGGPAWLGPALGLAPVASSLLGAGAGVAAGFTGAAVAGTAALAAFGAVAKPVLSQALAAEQAVSKAQSNYNIAIEHGTKQASAYKTEQVAIAKAYAGMSPQQIALSRQLGQMSDGWQKLKASQTPVVASALQPWLKSVTDLTGKLAPVIGEASFVIGSLGLKLDAVVSSKGFAKFASFVAVTGSGAAGAIGGTLIDFLNAAIILLPKFNPLIEKAVGGVSGLGPAVLKWSSSKKASDDITRFMGWFAKNGPAVSGLLKNVGGALKALAPGLGPASVAEMNTISGFFGLIAKLPPSVAKPLLEVAGVMLTLNKLGVVGIGVKILGLGGGAAGAAGEAAAGGAVAGLWSKILPGVRFAGGVLVATLVVETILKNTSSGTGKNWWDNPFGQGTYKDPESGQTKGTATALTSWITFGHDIEHYWGMVWHNTYDRMLHGFHDVAHGFDVFRHWSAHTWDDIRHDAAHYWDLTWNNTVGRLKRGLNDADPLLRGWGHNVAHWFDVARHDAAHIWDVLWQNTVGRAQRGVGDAVHWIGTLPGKITGIFKDAGKWLVNTGKSLIGGLISGIESMGSSVWKSISGLIPGGGIVSKAWHALGFAGGTSSAPPGWAWVGERGPELMRFRGGEQVMSAPASSAYAAARGGGDTYHITVNVPPTVNPREAGRQIGELILAHTKSGGHLYPAGVTPR